MYPDDWPRCACGDDVLDGHLTCGRVECSESAARDGFDHEIEGRIDLERGKS